MERAIERVTYLDEVIANIRNAVAEDALAVENTTDLFASCAVLLLAMENSVTREDVDNAWVTWIALKGEGDESHDSMVPFLELPPETLAEDSRFVVAFRTSLGPGTTLRVATGSVEIPVSYDAPHGTT